MTIVLTRPTIASDPIADALRAFGAQVLIIPTITIAPPDDFSPLDAALLAWAEFSGAVFASANSVRAVADRTAARELTLPIAPWLAAVGPATAAAVAAAFHRPATYVASDHHAEGLLDALASVPVRDRRILLPRAAEGRDTLAAGLAARGARVTAVSAYRTLTCTASREPLRACFATAAPGAVLLASPSAARALTELLGPDYTQHLRRTALVAIGPTTARAAAALGLPVAATAAAAAPDAVVTALRNLAHA